MTTAYEYATETVIEFLESLADEIEKICIDKVYPKEKEQYLRGYIKGVKDSERLVRNKIKYIKENGL